jgi:hypothetical protein
VVDAKRRAIFDAAVGYFGMSPEMLSKVRFNALTARSVGRS